MKKLTRIYRHKRISRKLRGRADQPRLVVFRSSKHIYAQVIDDSRQNVMVGVSTLSSEFKNKKMKSTTEKAAREVGKIIAAKVKEKKINSVCFDRAGYRYHGRVKSLAEGAREGGLKF